MGNSNEMSTGQLVKTALKYGAIVLALLIVLVYWPIRSVPMGSRGVVTTGGGFSGIKNEGFALVLPWQKLSIFSIRAEAVNVDNAGGASSDTQQVAISLTVRYNIIPDKVAFVYENYSHDGDLSNIVGTATMEAFKAVTARYTAPDLIGKRAAVSNDIKELLATKLAIYGAHVIAIDVRDFNFTKEYQDAINQKTVQDQLRQQADNQLKTVESQQKQKVVVAEANAAAVRAKADGDAYANLKIATAQADSLKVQNAALSQNKDVLELRRIEVEQTKAERWNGQLPQNVYASAPIPFFNVKQP